MRLAILITITGWALTEDTFTDSMILETVATEKTPFAASEDIFTTDDFGLFSQPSDLANEQRPSVDVKPAKLDVKPPAFSPQPPGHQKSSHRPPLKNPDMKSASFGGQPVPHSATYGDTLGADSAVLLPEKQELSVDEMESSGEQKPDFNPESIDTDEDSRTDNSEGDPVGRLEEDPVIRKLLQDFAAAVKEWSSPEKTMPSGILNVKLPTKINSINVTGSTNSQSQKLQGSVATFAEENVVVHPSPPHPRTPAKRGAVAGCPVPVMCTKNCFVYINEHGCQDCQCLWQALACDFDDDCPESAQFCDLGRCNCRPGMRQDMTRSGSCERDPAFTESPN
ncbi:hypothetical protein GCK32_006313, partial [Trichostrongylus colubriformis]